MNRFFPLESDAAWKRCLPYILVILVGAGLYAHTLHVPFYLDDDYAIGENTVVKDLSLAFRGLFFRRGLSFLTFAINYRFDGLNIISYHLVNIAIHLAAACLVLLLLRRVFPQRQGLPLFGALLFVAHPLQTQGVTYIVQRMTSLSALFFLLAVYLFVRAREVLADGAAMSDRGHLLRYAGALLAGGLAILSKENAIVLPVALLLFARLFPAGSDRRWQPLIYYAAPFVVLPAIAVFGYLLVPVLAGPGLNTMGYSGLLRSMEGNSPLHYLATQCSVLWIYIRMLFLPYGQALDHAYPVSRELLTLKSVTGFCGLAGLAALAWYLRRRQPAITFGVGWFFLSLAVESSIIPLDPLFEHRLYLPMFGFSVIAVALLAMIPRPTWRFGVGIGVIVVLAVLAWQRNALWNDPIAFWEDNLRITPDNERVCFNLGQEYLEAGFSEQGDERGRRIEFFEKGERMIRESIAMNPSRHFGYKALKELYAMQGRVDEAISMLRYGVEHVKYNHFLYTELAFLYGKKGDFDMAIAMSQQAIAADPKVPASYYNLAQLLAFVGEWDAVEQNLRKTLELDPNHADAKAMLANVRNGERWSSSPAQQGQPQ